MRQGEGQAYGCGSLPTGAAKSAVLALLPPVSLLSVRPPHLAFGDNSSFGLIQSRAWAVNHSQNIVYIQHPPCHGIPGRLGAFDQY